MSTTTVPCVSVVMPAHNEELHISEAIDSILNQSFTDLELIIVNDGSTDGTEAIIRRYTDPRISLFNNPANLGISGSMNVGIGLSRGKFIARMDADDISLPSRIAAQVKFMEEHPHIDFSGTFNTEFGTRQREATYPTDDIVIRTDMLRGSPFCNAGIIMRRDRLLALDILNDSAMDGAEDYDHIERLSEHFRFANIPEVHFHYRTHANNTSSSYGMRSLILVMKVRRRIFERLLGRALSESEMTLLTTAMGGPGGPLSAEEGSVVQELLTGVVQGAYQHPGYSGEHAAKLMDIFTNTQSHPQLS